MAVAILAQPLCHPPTRSPTHTPTHPSTHPTTQAANEPQGLLKGPISYNHSLCVGGWLGVASHNPKSIINKGHVVKRSRDPQGGTLFGGKVPPWLFACKQSARVGRWSWELELEFGNWNWELELGVGVGSWNWELELGVGVGSGSWFSWSLKFLI